MRLSSIFNTNTIASMINMLSGTPVIRLCYHPQDLTADEVRRINQGRKFDVIFDAIGNQLIGPVRCRWD
ncbi:hypothetical protein NLV76_01015 [Bacillus halotolerans]|nr:hypothetical protein [Bacillus halotolerans]UTL72914.1 hypothetical protein NLV76_01015 [Bacillus halotolerans]